MSWLWSGTSSSSSPSAPKLTADGSPEAPNRTDRAKCWAARDAFFACLEKNGIVDSLKDAEQTEKACGSLDAQLHKDCASSWVTYFKQRRVMELKKKAMLDGLKQEGAKEVPADSLPAGLSRPAPGSAGGVGAA